MIVDVDALVEAVADKVVLKLGNRLAGSTGAVRPRLLTAEQASVYLGRSKAAVEHMIASRKLPVVRADRRVFVDIVDLDHWIEENKQVGV